MLTGDLKRRNTVKARRLLRKLCTRRAAGGQSLQNRQHCTLGPLGLYEIFSVHFPKFLGRYVFLFFVLFCFVLFFDRENTQRDPLPIRKVTHTHTHRKPRQPEPRHIAPSTCSVDSAAQIPFPSRVCTAGTAALLKTPLRRAGSIGAGLSAEGQKENSLSAC